MTEHPLPINYCDLSDDQVTEIQLANYRRLWSKEQTDSSESFRPSAPPMDEGTKTSSQSQIHKSSEQQVVTATVHATDDSTSSNPSQQETQSPEQEERVLFLNVMAEGNDIHIGQIKRTMTTSPREGVTWGQSRFNPRSGATDLEILCTVNGSIRPSDLINDL